MIEIKNLDKIYNRRKKNNQVHAINNTSITFNNTGLVCILGESGSGKTTLMNVIGGLETFDKGQIQIDEKTMKKFSASAYENFRINKFAYIFQNYILMEDYTVEYNIKMALEPFNMKEEECDKRITEVLEELDILNLRNMLAGNLSGGQKQRVAIARALVKRPDVIFADEPTGNLDEANTIKIMNIMKSVAKHCLVMLVTHDRDLAAYYADRIINVHDGCIISDTINEGQKELVLHNDKNIYLKDYECQEINADGVSLKVYGSPEKKLTLSVVWKNGRYYIDRQSDEADTVVLDEYTQVKMIDGHMKDSLKTADSNINYEKISNTTKRYPFKMIWNLASMLSGGKKNKKKLMGVVCVVDALIMVAVITVVLTAYHPDRTKIVTSDSHYIAVDIEINYDYCRENQINPFSRIEKDFKDYYKDMYMDIRSIHAPESGKIISPATLVFYGNIFSQVRLLDSALDDFDFVDREMLDEDDIICGEKTDNYDEIVLDKWVADYIINSESVVFGEYNTYSDFVGKKVSSGNGTQILTITGVCDTGEPSVYVDKYAMLYISEWTKNIACEDTSLSKKVEELLEQNKDPKTELNSSYADMMKGALDDELHFLLYTTDKDEIMDQLKQLKSSDARADGLVITYECKADKQMSDYTARYLGVAKTFSLIAVVAAFLSGVVMYFLIKANVISQKNIMVVCQVNGIKRKYLVTAYSMQIIKLVGLTFIPTTLAMSVGIKLTVWLELVKVNIVYSWAYMIAIIVAFLIVCVVFTATEVYRIICKPMAKQGLIE